MKQITDLPPFVKYESHYYIVLRRADQSIVLFLDQRLREGRSLRPTERFHPAVSHTGRSPRGGQTDRKHHIIDLSAAQLTPPSSSLPPSRCPFCTPPFEIPIWVTARLPLLPLSSNKAQHKPKIKTQLCSGA